MTSSPTLTARAATTATRQQQPRPKRAKTTSSQRATPKAKPKAQKPKPKPKPKATKAKGVAKKKSAKEVVRAGLGRAVEVRLKAKGLSVVCGVDEAGRGPLAGPVVVAACIVPLTVSLHGINDSKQMTEADRERLFEELSAHPDVVSCICEVDEKEIDRTDIRKATLLGMSRAVEGLGCVPDHVMIDGCDVPQRVADQFPSAEAVIKGDTKVFSIACASVLAKVHRDRKMRELDAVHPGYGFAQHKGYPTMKHRSALFELGPCAVHRRTFAPVRNAIAAAAERAQKAKAQAQAQAMETANEDVGPGPQAATTGEGRSTRSTRSKKLSA